MHFRVYEWRLLRLCAVSSLRVTVKQVPSRTPKLTSSNWKNIKLLIMFLFIFIIRFRSRCNFAYPKITMHVRCTFSFDLIHRWEHIRRGGVETRVSIFYVLLITHIIMAKNCDCMSISLVVIKRKINISKLCIWMRNQGHSWLASNTTIRVLLLLLTHLWTSIVLNILLCNDS